MDNILSHLSSTPVTFNGLQKATGLSATHLALGLVDLAGKVTTQDGGFILAPEPVKATTGPRGPTAKVAPRLEACQADLLRMAGGEGGVTAKELLGQAGDKFVYTDILLVARNLLALGAITESRKGRKATWILASGV